MTSAVAVQRGSNPVLERVAPTPEDLEAAQSDALWVEVGRLRGSRAGPSTTLLRHHLAASSWAYGSGSSLSFSTLCS